MKQKTTFFLFFIVLIPSIWAQNKIENTFIEYDSYRNEKLAKQENPIILIANAHASLLTKQKDFSRTFAVYPIEEFLYNYNQKRAYSIAQLNSKDRIGTEISDFEAKYTFEHSKKTKSIQGQLCHFATTIINSNKYEIWYNKDLGLYGSPIKIGADLGLVLEIKRNNDFRIVARKINPKIPYEFEKLVKLNEMKLVDELSYAEIIWKEKFTTLPIFEDEIINFSENSESNDSIFRFSNGTVILRKVKFPKLKDGAQIFIDVTEQSNGDAYDRTGSVFIIPTFQDITFLDALQYGIEKLPTYKTSEPSKIYQGVIASPDYTPNMELMRFFTPFGISAFNHIKIKNHDWHEKVFYRQDISEFTPLLENREWYVGIYIGNYDKGGHKVSANFTIHNSKLKTPAPTVFMPLFNTTNVMEMSGQEYPTMFNSKEGLSVTFEIEKPIENAYLRYITTGHGGWENGDEFNPKNNDIYIDNKLVHSFIPWRQDCGSYRMYNPASGNFNNGLSSSDLSRSNWCPGTVTNPSVIPLGTLEAGKHTMTIKIKQGNKEGQSFSYWNVSGILIGY